MVLNLLLFAVKRQLKFLKPWSNRSIHHFCRTTYKLHVEFYLTDWFDAVILLSMIVIHAICRTVCLGGGSAVVMIITFRSLACHKWVQNVTLSNKSTSFVSPDSGGKQISHKLTEVWCSHMWLHSMGSQEININNRLIANDSWLKVCDINVKTNYQLRQVHLYHSCALLFLYIFHWSYYRTRFAESFTKHNQFARTEHDES
jgi:hypothetical protein